MTDTRTPVSLLTGFLGSGKTTLVNHVLQADHGERIAVIVNEFGEVPIDGSLIVGTSEDLVQLQNGCICCTIRGDLQDTVSRLLERRRRRFFRRLRFDRILIEASGMASPGPVLQTFLADDRLAGATRIDGVIALAHAVHVERQVAEHPEAAHQLGYADRVLLNHVDRADEGTIRAAEEAVRRLNPVAAIVRTEFARVEVGLVLGVGATDPARWRLEEEMARAVGIEAAADGEVDSCSDPQCDHTGHAATAAGSALHTQGVSSVTFRTTERLDLHRLQIWLRFVAARRKWEVMRIKGIVRPRSHGPLAVVQGVYQWVEVKMAAGPPPEESIVVMIGKDLDHAELRRGWEAVTRAE